VRRSVCEGRVKASDVGMVIVRRLKAHRPTNPTRVFCRFGDLGRRFRGLFCSRFAAFGSTRIRNFC
jgi:hypothetical protein